MSQRQAHTVFKEPNKARSQHRVSWVHERRSPAAHHAACLCQSLNGGGRTPRPPNPLVCVHTFLLQCYHYFCPQECWDPDIKGAPELFAPPAHHGSPGVSRTHSSIICVCIFLPTGTGPAKQNSPWWASTCTASIKHSIDTSEEFKWNETLSGVTGAIKGIQPKWPTILFNKTTSTYEKVTVVRSPYSQTRGPAPCPPAPPCTCNFMPRTNDWLRKPFHFSLESSWFRTPFLCLGNFQKPFCTNQWRWILPLMRMITLVHSHHMCLESLQREEKHRSFWTQMSSVRKIYHCGVYHS